MEHVDFEELQMQFMSKACVLLDEYHIAYTVEDTGGKIVLHCVVPESKMDNLSDAAYDIQNLTDKTKALGDPLLDIEMRILRSTSKPPVQASMELNFSDERGRAAARKYLDEKAKSMDPSILRPAVIALNAVTMVEIIAMMISGFLTPADAQKRIGELAVEEYQKGDLCEISGLRF